MIEFRDIKKSYKKHQVLKDVNFTLGDSGVIALLGPNGSGKTTLLKCLLGMVIPDSGSILYQEKNILGTFEYRNDFGYLSQIGRFPENLTAQEVIDLMKSMKDKPCRDEELIKRFGVEGELSKKMGNLSGGNRQKINIILALMFDDPVIILDEPSSGLDPLSLQRLKKQLEIERANNKLIILTTHIMSLAEELADNVLFLLDGKVYFDGRIQDLMVGQNSNNLEEAIAHILRSEQEKKKDEEYHKV